MSKPKKPKVGFVRDLLIREFDMLQDARTAAMRKLHCSAEDACVSPVWAVFAGDGSRQM